MLREAYDDPFMGRAKGRPRRPSWQAWTVTVLGALTLIANFPTAASAAHRPEIGGGRATSSAAFSAFENFTVSGACDYGSHTNALSAQVLFNRQRYPHGAWVRLEITYAHFNPGNPAQRTSRWSFIGWTKATVKRPNIYIVPENFEHESYPIISPTTLFSNYSLPVHTGVFKAYVRAAVWNGERWEVSGWTSPAAGYLDSNNGVSPIYATTCWVGPF